MLNVYSNFTPNTTNTFYYFTNITNYITNNAQYLTTTITNDNYRINNDICIIKLQTPLTTGNYKNITYITNTDDYMSYHVKSARLQSGCIYLELSKDLWASFIYLSTLDKIYVRKCNRRIDEISTLTGKVFCTYDKTDNLTEILDYGALETVSKSQLQNWCIVYVIENNTIHSIQIFYARLDTAFSGIPSNTNYLYYAQFSGQSTKLFTNDGEDDITVKSMFILPYGKINTMPNASSRFVNVQLGTSAIRYTTASLNLAKPERNFSYYELNITGNDSNNNYYVGCKNNLLELKTKQPKTMIHVYYNISFTDIQITINANGDDIKDISNSYKVAFVSSEEQAHATRDIATAMQIITGSIGAILGGTSGSPLTLTKGISQIGKGIESAVESHKPSYSYSIVGQADASITFYNDDIAYLSTPLHIFKSTGILNYSNRYGATFNATMTITEFNNMFLQSLISGDITDTYVMGDIKVNGVPDDARQFIENIFSNGVYLIKL